MPSDNGISGTAIAVVLAGTVLAYSGVKGESITKTITQLISGKKPNGTDEPISTTPIITDVNSDDNLIHQGVSTNASAVANRALAKLLAAPYGWSTGDQWTALSNTWQRESSWSNTATGSETSDGHAYGIPQALPSSKLPLLGRPSSEGGISDPRSQISWGLAYIKSRYGDPITAWQHELSNGWY